MTEQQEIDEINRLSKNIPTYEKATFKPSVKKGDKYRFSDGKETVAECDSYLNCDNMECCVWSGFGFWLVCHMEKCQ